MSAFGPAAVLGDLSLDDLNRARRDPRAFADLVLREPLFDHQVEVVESGARYRVLCAGRRAGKTRVFGVLALHRMYSVPGSRVMIISAGDTSVKRTHAEISAMAAASVGGSSVADDNVHTLTLSNGSVLESVPSSIKAARSADVDLLIVDEAGFVDQGVWEAAEPTIGARRGSRVLIASTPWMGPGHFFHDLWRQGMDRPNSEVTSWHWPSTVNPLVDRVWLEGVKERSSWDYFAREYMAEWSGSSGAYFDEGELMACVADYELLDAAAIRDLSPFVDGRGSVRVFPAVAGVDWGMRRDANAVALVSPVARPAEVQAQRRVLTAEQPVMFVPYLAAESGWQWDAFAGHVAELASAYALKMIASELNGVGDAATRMLELEVARRVGYGGTWVRGVWTDMRRKQAGFGKIKLLLQRRLLALPRHPELLKQLRSLEFEQTQGGGVRIAVPDNRGHDDLAMALLQAVSCLGDPEHWAMARHGSAWSQALGMAPGGLAPAPLPARPLPDREMRDSWFFAPQGEERGEPW